MEAVKIDNPRDLARWDMYEHLERLENKLDKLLEAKKRKPRASVVEYDEFFEETWLCLPRRIGGNPKRKAYSAYRKRLKDHGDDEKFAIYDGVMRYKHFCDETGKSHTEYVMQAATFFGPDKHYLEDFTIPTQAETMPKSNDELVAWSESKGFRPPRPGESFTAYRMAVNQLYQSNS